MPEMSMTDFSVVPRLSENEILGKIATNTHKCHNFDFNDYETLWCSEARQGGANQFEISTFDILGFHP